MTLTCDEVQVSSTACKEFFASNKATVREAREEAATTLRWGTISDQFDVFDFCPTHFERRKR